MQDLRTDVQKRRTRIAAAEAIIGIAADLSAQRSCRGTARQRSKRRRRHQGDTCA